MWPVLALRKGESNDQPDFNALTRFSVSERALPTAGTSLLLHGSLSLDTHRDRLDVAHISGSPRDADVEMKRIGTGGET
jgi:hypothetical protein